MSIEWADVQKRAAQELLKRKLDGEYKDRLLFEFKEINKQGASDYWVELLNAEKTFDHNDNGLVLPWLLGITRIDPIAEGIEHNIQYQPDFPDIDIDFLPHARGPVREFAIQQYGADKVCAVGAWQTYGPKLALQDAAPALGYDRHKSIALTRELPQAFDDLTLKQALDEFEAFKKFYEDNKDLVDIAYRMKGMIKTQLRHAGGLIISSVPVRDHLPLTMSNDVWTSAWTEGRNTQLSKFGFIKFDFLGLKNLLYIWTACNLIKENRGIEIDWEDMDPDVDRAGWQKDEKGDHPILFNDEKAIQSADRVQVDSIFQFETELSKSIIQKGGVKEFKDLVVYSALGRPGPLPMVDVYIARRDGKVRVDGETGERIDESKWMDGEDERIIDILGDTYGVIVYQEQLATIWRKLAGFTAPEAEAARKAVAKKWVEKLVPIEEKWLRGASKTLGEESAKEWWEKMVTFGRYAFNVSHVSAYITIAYRCIWLKAHFPAEWWAAVMSDCHSEKLKRYMSVARAEGVEFTDMHCDKLTTKFTVLGDHVTPGLMGVKGIGESAAKEFSGKGPYDSLDHFVERHGKSKTVLERLIKLGGFRAKHDNKKALWMWYLYKHGSGTYMTALRRLIRCCYCWTNEEIQEERLRKERAWRKEYPNRTKVPVKITNWVPTLPIDKPRFNVLENAVLFVEKVGKETTILERRSPGDEGFWDKVAKDLSQLRLDDEAAEEYKTSNKVVIQSKHVMQLFEFDYTLTEILEFEKSFLGFYWNSPLDQFKHDGCSINYARSHETLEVVIEEREERQGASSTFLQLIVTDGVESAKVMVWSDAWQNNGDEVFDPGIGLRMKVNWNEKYRSFNLRKNTICIPLERV